MSGDAAPRLRLLGVPTWRDESSDIVFRAERPYQLLAILACRGTWTTRDELAEFMWPERGQSGARGNLRTLLLRASGISPDIVIEQHADRLRWRPDSDLVRLERAFAEGRFADVVALYRGPLLRAMDTGLSGAVVEWLQFERDRAASLWRIAAGKEMDAAGADPGRTAALAESILAEDPYDEAAVAILARALGAQDRTADGLRVLKAHAERVAASFGVAPSAALRDLQAALSRPAPSATAPRSIPPSPGAAGPALVGRRLELLQIQELMRQPECRVLTITGLGGVGKSRLARAAVSLLVPQFVDGVFWVELGDLTEADQLPARIAQSLGLALPGGGDPWDDIEHQLAAKSLLLAIDNSEHLGDLAPRLARWLERCPGLCLLNTSRARLAIAGEWLLPLDGLPVPDDDETDVQVLRLCDAVRLFESRALAANPSFDLKAQAADVAALVRAVDGLPLAIELAATWVRMLPVQAIVAELTQSLDLLDQTIVVGRDRGFRASFEQSWRLLGDAERGALARLGLLPGAFERDMAAQVAQCGLPLLAALVDKSLLQADGRDGYSLHPLVRQGAAEKAMAGAGDPVVQRTRHLSFMTHWLARVSRLGGGGKADDETRRALPHIRSAWQWALERREPAIVMAGANRLAQFYGGHGLLAEGREAMQRALATFADGDTTAQRAAAWAAVAQANLWHRSGGFAEAERLGRLAASLAEGAHDSELQVMSLNVAGSAVGFGGANEASLPLLEDALARARLHGHHLLEGIVLGNLARALKALGRYAEAGEMMVEALANARAADPPNHDGVVLQTSNLGNLHAATGQWDRALGLFGQALEECEARGASLYRPLILMNLARAHLALGHIDAARAHALSALEVATAQGRDLYALYLHLVLMRTALAQADPAAATASLLDALMLADGLKLGPEWVRCVVAGGELLSATGDTAGAVALWQWTLDQPGMPADDTEDTTRRLRAAGGALVPTAEATVDGLRSPAAVAAWVATRCRSLPKGSLPPPAPP